MILAKDENSAQGFEATTMTRDEMDKAQALTIQIFLLLATTLISIGGRVFMRWRRVGLKSFGLDDALAIAGGLFFVPNVVLAYLMNTRTHWMGNQSSLKSESSSGYQLREMGSKYYLYSWLCYSVALWTFKAAFHANILRRTAESDRRQAHKYLGFFFLILTWTATLITFLQSCRPLSNMWQVYPDPGRVCQPATSPVLVWVYFCFDVTTNLYLAVAAMPLAVRQGKPTRENLKWLATLGCGLLITAAAIARAVILVSGHDTNAEQSAQTLAIWQIFILAIAVHLTGSFDTPTRSFSYPHTKDMDDTNFNNFMYSTRFSTRQDSVADSEVTIVATPSAEEAYNKFAEVSVQEIVPEGRRNSGIERKVEFSVLQENFVMVPEGPCEICGNYTRGWANDDGANKPEQRSSYFGNAIHFHVPNYGTERKDAN